MTPNIPQWLSIKERILAEYKKHPSLDWAEIAARKIAGSLTTLTDEELQREAEREYPYRKWENTFSQFAYDADCKTVDRERRAYINGRKKSLERKTKNPT